MNAGAAMGTAMRKAVAAPPVNKHGGSLVPLLKTSVSGYRPGGKCIRNAEPDAWPYELIWGVPGYARQRAGSSNLKLLEFAAECLMRSGGAAQALGIANIKTGSVKIPGVAKWQKR